MKNPSRDAPIGILAALPEEMEPLLEELQPGAHGTDGTGSLHSAKSSPEAGAKVRLRFHRGTIGGREAVVVCCGTGKVNAAVAAQLLVDRFGVGCLLLSGIGGALYPEARAGDAIIGTELIHHDVGFLYGKEDFISCGVRIWPDCLEGDPSPLRVASFLSDGAWVAAACRAGEELRHRGLMVRSGPIVTGEYVVFSSDKKQWLRETFQALAVEMEGAAVAQTAYLNGLPFLIVRAISDHSDEKIVQGRQTVEKLARAVRPGAVIQNDPALRRRLSLAANNAALLLKTAIAHYELI